MSQSMVDKVQETLKEEMKGARTVEQQLLVATVCTTTLLARVVDELQAIDKTLRTGRS